MSDEAGGVAQSEVIGVVIILGITFTGISIILVTGAPTLDDTRELARTSTAENGMSLLDERVSSSALSGSRIKEFTLNLRSGELSISPESGGMRIYSSPPVQIWSRGPGKPEAKHVLNFTVEADSEIAGNATSPRRVDEVTIDYPNTFLILTSTSVVTQGVDLDIDGTVDRGLSSSLSPSATSLTIDVDETDPDSRINETNLLTFEYGDVAQPPPGEYPVDVTVENNASETVTKEATIEIGDDVTPPKSQIDREMEMGKIEYETDENVIGYQNGGVWTKPVGEDTVSRTTSKPEVYYDGNTLTASVINITNTANISLGGSPSLRAVNTDTERVFPVQGTDRRNPLQNRNVYMVVNTSYYNAWSDYFESETVGDVVEVTGSGETREVAVELSPLPDTVFNQAIVTRDGNVTLMNSTVDSYDSAVSDYSPRFRFGNGDIAAGGNVSLQNDSGTSALLSRVYGDVLAGDRTVMQNRTVVNGSVKARGYAGAPGGENITVEGAGCRVQNELVAPGVIGAPNCDASQKSDRLPSETVPRPELVDDEVNEAIEDYSGSFPSGTVTSGNYLVDRSPTSPVRTVNSDITFDTTGGPINIAINHSDDSRLVFDGIEIEINGTNPVRIYSGNSSSLVTSGQEKVVFDGATMDVEDNRTDLFSVLFHSTNSANTAMLIEDDTEFFGTIYAPDMEYLTITDSEVYGAVVADETEIVESEIHYDQQLRDPRAEGVSAVNYLHVTDNQVAIR